MNSNIFAFILNALLTIFFVLLGIFTLILPWTDTFRVTLFEFISLHKLTMFIIAMACFAMSALLFTAAMGNRKHRYRIKTGSNSVKVDPTLIKQSLTPLWKKLFGTKDIPSAVEIKNNQIHISAHLPYYPFDKQKELIKQLEGDLVKSLEATLDYREPLFLSISFEKNSNLNGFNSKTVTKQ